MADPKRKSFDPRDLPRAYSWADSRDNRGTDFENYIDPSFYGGEPNDWIVLLSSSVLRDNRELLAINEPHLSAVYRNRQGVRFLQNTLVSPVIPRGIYKTGTTANCYFWFDDIQLSMAFKLIPLGEIDPLTLEEQVGQRFLSQFIDTFGSVITSSLPEVKGYQVGQTLLGVLDWLEDSSLNFENTIGVWVPVGSVVTSQKIVTSKGVPDPLSSLVDFEKSTFPLLPLALIGGGLFTGVIPLTGLGAFLFIKDLK